MRAGIDRATGQVLTGWRHCAQSILDIATTAIGSRVLRRDYGSDAPALQDRPFNGAGIMDHFVAIARALRLWEPEFRLRRIKAAQLGPGIAGFELIGDYYPNGLSGDFTRVVKMLSVAVPIELLT